MPRIPSLMLVVACLALLAGPLAPAPSALAQGIDPATLIPASVAAYAEVRVDENLEANLQDLVRIGARLSGDTPRQAEAAAAEVSLDAALGEVFPNIDFAEDILPWLGGQAGVGLLAAPEMADPDFVAILPILDQGRAEAFLSGLTATFQDVTTWGDATIYSFPEHQLVVTPTAVWLGTPPAVEEALAVRDEARPPLSKLDGFTQTRLALPAGWLASLYVSGPWLSETFSQRGALSDAMLRPALAFALRLHPGNSRMEQALLGEVRGLRSLGLALDLSAERLDVAALLSLEAQYPAPALPAPPASLLGYVPGDAFLVLDSYDLGGAALHIVSLALLGPYVGNVFEQIVEGQEDTAPLTPRPTPAPPTYEELTAQVRPFLRQIETALGVSMDELFTLLSGEYALAFSPVDRSNLPRELRTLEAGMTLWLHTPDPARLVAVLDNAITALEGLQGGAGLVRLEETVSGVDVVTWRAEGTGGDLLTYGTLGRNTVFLTIGTDLATIAAAAHGDGTLPQSASWPDEVMADYTASSELLYYMDWEEAAPYMDTTYDPGLFEALIMGLDLQDDGLFSLRATLTRPPEGDG